MRNTARLSSRRQAGDGGWRSAYTFCVSHFCMAQFKAGPVGRACATWACWLPVADSDVPTGCLTLLLVPLSKPHPRASTVLVDEHDGMPHLAASTFGPGVASESVNLAI